MIKIPKIKNEWITYPNKTFNGLSVQRCAGPPVFDWSTPDADGYSVPTVKIKYFFRELYPNGEVNKEYEKTYTLENLAETDIDATHFMPALNVLDSFIASLGQNAIVNPILSTLGDVNVLPFDSPNDYPLHLNTRQILER